MLLLNKIHMFVLLFSFSPLSSDGEEKSANTNANRCTALACRSRSTSIALLIPRLHQRLMHGIRLILIAAMSFQRKMVLHTFHGLMCSWSCPRRTMPANREFEMLHTTSGSKHIYIASNSYCVRPLGSNIQTTLDNSL